MGASMGSRANRRGPHLATRVVECPVPPPAPSSDGSRPNSSCSRKATRRILEILSTKWTGSRMVLDWLAKARFDDCLIHQEP